MISVEQVKDELHMSYFDVNGDNKVIKMKIPERFHYVWDDCEANDPRREPTLKSQYLTPVKKKKAFYWNKYRVAELINQSQPLQSILFSPNRPRKYFMDIETEVIEGFPDVTVAREKILTYAVCDQNGDGFVTGLRPLDDAQKKRLNDRLNDYFKTLNRKFDVKFRFYESETLMMQDFMHNEVKNMPWISGWNFLKFDWAYINKRCSNLGIDYRRASPTRSMERITFKDKYDKTKKWIVEVPRHRAIIDYQFVYEKWDTIVKFKENVSLDAVAKEVLGFEKVKYNGSLMDLYNNDYETYIFYNMVDTILVALIDEKLLTFNTMYAISNEARIQLNDAMFTSISVEAKMGDEFRNKGIVFVPRKKKDREEKTESYSGGYVYEPIQGLHFFLSVVDFESMFPSIMMAFNLGVDTLVGQIDKTAKPWTIKHHITGETIPFSSKIHINTAGGFAYSKLEQSTLRGFISTMINKRVLAKEAASQVENEIATLKEMLPSAN
jgi:DNA polymerase elongation subunit (family B)